MGTSLGSDWLVPPAGTSQLVHNTIVTSEPRLYTKPSANNPIRLCDRNGKHGISINTDRFNCNKTAISQFSHSLPSQPPQIWMLHRTKFDSRKVMTISQPMHKTDTTSSGLWKGMLRSSCRLTCTCLRKFITWECEKHYWTPSLCFNWSSAITQ